MATFPVASQATGGLLGWFRKEIVTLEGTSMVEYLKTMIHWRAS
jgi:hypothetical protein